MSELAIRRPLGTLAALILLVSPATTAEQPLTLKQIRDGAPAETLSTAEFAVLRDPFFVAVLREHADVVTLAGVENLLLAEGVERRLFVVDENIRNPRRFQPRRSVLAYRGNHPIAGVLAPNVMLSVFFDSEDFEDAPAAIEAWGWDNHRGRYNYYKMDRSGTPTLALTWKFRGSSVDADLLNPEERRFTCMQCHINGGPVMKELPFPWNNWHSVRSEATYLRPGSPDAWPVAKNERLANLRGAEELEKQFIVDAITQFNTRRINQALDRRDDNGDIRIDNNGLARMVEGRRLLRPLFETTEVNFISSPQKSGMHPLDPNRAGEPSRPTAIPNALFLNADLIAGNGATGIRGLAIAEAAKFNTVAIASPQAYKAAVDELGLQLAGKPGDADFAWFIPEPSHIDNSMVDRLLRRGIVTPQFVAAVAAVDLETPIFSEDRRSLLAFIPDSFPFRPRAAGADPAPHPDPLTTAVIARLRQTNPAVGSIAREFLQLLEADDPVAELRQRVASYRACIQTEARDDPEFVKNQLRRADELRKRFISHPVLSSLDETGDRLLPVAP